MMQRFFLLLILLAILVPAQVTYSQEFDEDAELLEETEEMPPPAPLEEDAPPPPPPPSSSPSRFRPGSRFGGSNSSAPSRFSPPSTSSSDSSAGGDFSATTPGSTLKGKMPFMDAQPEDITNKNFPDVVQSFDYRDAPIADVVNAMARLTGKRFIFEQNLSGKITIISPGKITVAEAWEAFLSALAMNQMTVVPSGKFLKIRKIDDAKADSLDIYSGAYYPAGDQLITRIIRLKYISADDVSKTFDKVLKSKQGQVVPYEKTNSLIVTDLGSNVDRISRVLEELDKPGFEEQLKVIPIRNAKAKDLADLVDKIINKGEDKKKNTFRPASRFGAQEKNESLSLVTPDERTNSIIVVGNSEGIERIVKLVHQLDYPLDPADAGGVYVYYVKHGEAKKIADTLSGIAQEQEKKATSSAPVNDPNNPSNFAAPKQKQQLFGGDVIIKADENTNSLIVTANKQDYNTVLNLLGKIDIPKDQVYVQAFIVELDTQKTDNWSFNVLKFAGGDTNAANADGNTLARAGYVTGNVGSLNNLAQDGGIFGFGRGDKVAVRFGTQQVTIPSLIGFIELLKTTINANVLTAPQVVAIDNETSVIEVGDEVPVAVTSAASTSGVAQQNVQFKEATIKLEIKPFISPDSNVVTLQIQQQANDVSTKAPPAQLGQISQGIKKRTLKTNLTLQSGDTAVLGGLIQDSERVTEKKVPFLGDIPVLGWLFKSKKVERNKNNLMVFLSPQIIRGSGDYKKLAKVKMEERIRWVKRYNNGRDPFGEYLEPMKKFAEAPDEFNLEDQSLSPSQPTDVAPTPEQPPLPSDTETFDNNPPNVERIEDELPVEAE